MILSHEFYSKCQGQRLGSFSRCVSFDGPLFTLRSGSVTECNLHSRHKKGRGWGWGWYSPIKVTGLLVRKF